MDCQSIVFSLQQSENRINKALKVLPLKLVTIQHNPGDCPNCSYLPS